MKIAGKIFYVLFIISIINLSIYSEGHVSAKGPILSSNLFPLYLPYINIKPERASTIGDSNSKISFSYNYANNYHYDTEYLYDDFIFHLDMEIYEAAFKFDYGIADKLDLGFSLSYTGAYDGLFDGVISSFHKLFNLPDSNRSEVSKNTFEYYIENTEGDYIEQTEPFGDINNIILRAKYEFYENATNDLFLSFQYGIKIPKTKGFGPLSSGKIDHSYNVLIEKNFLNMSLYGSFGFIKLGKPDNLEVFEFQENLINYILAMEFLVSENLSFIIQFDGSSSPYKTEVSHRYIDLHSATSNFGFKYELRDQEYVTLSVMEEGVSFATIDFGVTFSYEKLF